MMLPRNAQEWVHWLEMGGGALWLRRGVWLLALAVLSGWIAYKQFDGPRTEMTLLQAGVARQLAAGEGFTTLVNYPQSVAFFRDRGLDFDPGLPYSEVTQPPLYPLVLSAALRLLPMDAWNRPIDAPNGHPADYLLLAVNIGLLWLAAGQTWSLGRRLFGPRAGSLAAVGLLLTAGIWNQTVAVNGTPLAMVILLGIFQCLASAHASEQAGRSAAMAWAGVGVGCGLLFLTEYTAGVLVVVLAIHAWRTSPDRRRRWISTGALLAAACLVALPWCLRNIQVAGHPVALARQDVALRAGDPTAEPARVRTTLSATEPAINLRKLANKGLSAVQQTLQRDVWVAGLFFSALFAAGWLYPFRAAEVRRMRAVFTASLLALVLAQAFLNSGESERWPAFYAAPLVMIFGAGFFTVLAGSNPTLAPWPALTAAGLLLLQAVPLLQDVLEPRRAHFHYPPYHPSLFAGMGQELRRHEDQRLGWMADAPAGAAWYSGQRVWAQPQSLREFYLISIEQPLLALVLSPETLDRPFFAELNPSGVEESRFGDWGRIYAGLIDGRMPREFPLQQMQRIADNYRVLIDPRPRPLPGK